MAVLRYLVFIAVGLLVGSLLFLVLSLIVSANFESSVDVVERWIVKATCDQYELKGTIRDTRGQPVPFAVIEASYLDERLSTRSNVDGRFALTAPEAECNRRPPANVEVLVMADDYRPKRQTIPFEAAEFDFTLDARDFRP